MAKNPPKTISLDTPPDQLANQPATTQSTPNPTTQTPSTNNQTPTNIKPKIVKPMDQKPKPNLKKIALTLGTALVIVAAGTLTGFGLSKAFNPQSAIITKSAEQVQEQGIQVGDTIGSPDTNTFPDTAEGVLIVGGVDGEGSHHLLRPGGKSQNVYLTSSVLDLDQLVDHKIKVWGETFAAQKAGWLMDVGRAEVLELNAEKPFEEE